MKINEVEREGRRRERRDSNTISTRTGAENFVGLHEDYNEKYQRKNEEKYNEINSFLAFDGYFHRRRESFSQKRAEVEARGQGLTYYLNSVIYTCAFRRAREENGK